MYNRCVLMRKDITNIQVTKEFAKELNALKDFGETYQQLIYRLVKSYKKNNK